MAFLIFMVSFAWAEMIEKGPDPSPPTDEGAGFYLLDPLSPKHECPVLNIVTPFIIKVNCVYLYDTEKNEHIIPTKCLLYLKSEAFKQGVFFGSNICEIIVREEKSSA